MYQIAYNIEVATLLLAISVLVFLRKRHWVQMAALIIYVILVDLFSRFAAIKMPNGIYSNHYYYNLARIPEIIFIIWIWQAEMGATLKKKLIPVILSFLWLAFSLVNILFIQGLYKLNTGSFLFGSVILISLSSIALFKIVDEKNESSFFHLPIAWFWSALLISNTFTFAYRVFEPLTNFSNNLLFQSTIIVAAIIKYLFISISFILMLRDKFLPRKNGRYHTSGA